MNQDSALLLAALRIGLTLMGLAAAGGAWIWWQRRHPPAPRKLRVQDRLAVGRGISLLLVEVEDQKLLVGVSTDGVRLVRNFGHVTRKTETHSASSSKGPTPFAALLSRAAGMRR